VNSRPQVLVLGGGYAAYTITRALRRAIKRGQVDCTVVSRENFHAFHGFIGEMLTGRVSASHILSPARRIFAPAKLHVAEIEKVDLDQKSVITSRRLDGRRFELSYDHLVISMGIRDRTDVYPGLEEHAFRLKTYPDCFRLRNHIIEMFELASIETDPEERRRLLTFFVAGGGFAGTEVAGELADFARRLTEREYSSISKDECRFVLVEPGPTILPEVYGQHEGPRSYPRLAKLAMERQKELGLEVRTNTFVTSASPQEVTLSNDERVPTRTIISAVGMKPNALVERLPLEKDERGRIVTENTLRVPGRQGVWAGGDCSSVRHPQGGTCPPVAMYALKHGTRIGQNILLELEGKSPKRFSFRGFGQLVSVGNRYAVGEIQGREVHGLPAWLMWRMLLLWHFPGWDRRLRLVGDWLIWPIVGRDIVQLHVDRPGDYDLRQNLYQPGEAIAVEGVQSRYVHVIVEGEVELVEVKTDGDTRVLKTLGPGDHFGIRWIESFEREIARAKTEVRTIAVRRDQAPELQEVLDSAGRLVAESGHFPAITRDMGPIPAPTDGE
jgi:NADH:ubiquinone reductase (H+-translocating)